MHRLTGFGCSLVLVQDILNVIVIAVSVTSQTLLEPRGLCLSIVPRAYNSNLKLSFPAYRTIIRRYRPNLFPKSPQLSPQSVFRSRSNKWSHILKNRRIWNRERKSSQPTTIIKWMAKVDLVRCRKRTSDVCTDARSGPTAKMDFAMCWKLTRRLATDYVFIFTGTFASPILQQPRGRNMTFLRCVFRRRFWSFGSWFTKASFCCAVVKAKAIDCVLCV